MSTYRELLEQAWEAETAYYVNDSPIMSDAEYDTLLKQIKGMESTMQASAINPNSPTQRVGGAVSGAFARVEHPVQMLSLDNVFDEDGISRLYAAAAKVGDASMLVEPKLDGLTLVVTYSDGALVSAVTRGDGLGGEDVTVTARTIRNLPLHTSYPGKFSARGEVLMPKASFEELNLKMVAAGQQPFANPRNAAAGSLRQKDPAVASGRGLVVCFYDIIDSGSEFPTEQQKLECLKRRGLPTLLADTTVAADATQAYSACNEWNNKRESLDFDIDGVVLKINSVAVQKILGVGTKTPKWATAYKFPAQHVEATLLGVDWQVGRTGHVTPVAEMTPVTIAGTVVDHASLHNADYINAMDLHIGDKISVYKAAEIIPQVAKVLVSNGGEKVCAPNQCPCCGGALESDGAALVCANVKCSAKLKAWIEYFGSRQHMDIKGLGSAVISQLVDTGLCSTPADLYSLTKKQLLTLDGFADKKADALLLEIASSKHKPYHKVLASLGVDSLGDSTAKDLDMAGLGIDDLLAEDECALTSIPGIGLVTSKAIHQSLHTEQMQSLVCGLRKAGCELSPDGNRSGGVLSGMSICITGTLEKPRAHYQELIESNGGRFSASISKATTYLVAGTGGGEKRSKATKLGVPIISEEQLMEIINGRATD